MSGLGVSCTALRSTAASPASLVAECNMELATGESIQGIACTAYVQLPLMSSLSGRWKIVAARPLNETQAGQLSLTVSFCIICA